MSRYKFTESPHAHWLDGKPLNGTTEVLKVISKPLTWWASGMAVGEMGWLHSKKHDKNERIIRAGEKLTEIKLMNVGQYIRLLDTAYKAHDEKKKSRAEEGTDLHDEAEQWINFKMGKAPIPFLPEGEDKLKPFKEWCNKNVKKFIFSEIHCYSEDLWIGGKTDFAYEDYQDRVVLADIKSRDKAYPSDHLQCGGYHLQLRENGGFDKDGNKVWDYRHFTHHAIFPLGDNFKEPVFSKSISDNQTGFRHALGLSKIMRTFEK